MIFDIRGWWALTLGGEDYELWPDIQVFGVAVPSRLLEALVIQSPKLSKVSTQYKGRFS